MVGYPETLTDPSYRGQIIVFTQPLIGNYGVPSTDARDEFNLLKYFESEYMQPAGVVVGDISANYSHWSAVQSLQEWCTQQGVPGITGVDTREVVTLLRERGSTLGRISVGESYDTDQDESYSDPGQINLVQHVSTKAPFHVAANGDVHIALIDCGVKEGILRSLCQRGANVTVFPWDYPIYKVAQAFDGFFISNGPGDPTHCTPTVTGLRELMRISQAPIFGICLGHQLLGLAVGARTTKLKYGNRAHNIPCLDLTTNRCHITSQNHGYAVEAASLPSDFKEYWVNLKYALNQYKLVIHDIALIDNSDSSNEGMIHKLRPIFSTQFHPEAKGGPTDTAFLFDIYLDRVHRYKKSRPLSRMAGPVGIDPLLSQILGKKRLDVATDSIRYAETRVQPRVSV